MWISWRSHVLLTPPCTAPLRPSPPEAQAVGKAHIVDILPSQHAEGIHHIQYFEKKVHCIILFVPQGGPWENVDWVTPAYQWVI